MEFEKHALIRPSGEGKIIFRKRRRVSAGTYGLTDLMLALSEHRIQPWFLYGQCCCHRIFHGGMVVRLDGSSSSMRMEDGVKASSFNMWNSQLHALVELWVGQSFWNCWPSIVKFFTFLKALSSKRARVLLFFHLNPLEGWHLQKWFVGSQTYSRELFLQINWYEFSMFPAEYFFLWSFANLHVNLTPGIANVFHACLVAIEIYILLNK